MKYLKNKEIKKLVIGLTIVNLLLAITQGLSGVEVIELCVDFFMGQVLIFVVYLLLTIYQKWINETLSRIETNMTHDQQVMKDKLDTLGHELGRKHITIYRLLEGLSNQLKSNADNEFNMLNRILEKMLQQYDAILQLQQTGNTNHIQGEKNHQETRTLIEKLSFNSDLENKQIKKQLGEEGIKNTVEIIKQIHEHESNLQGLLSTLRSQLASEFVQIKNADVEAAKIITDLLQTIDNQWNEYWGELKIETQSKDVAISDTLQKIFTATEIQSNDLAAVERNLTSAVGDGMKQSQVLIDSRSKEIIHQLNHSDEHLKLLGSRSKEVMDQVRHSEEQLQQLVKEENKKVTAILLENSSGLLKTLSENLNKLFNSLSSELMHASEVEHLKTSIIKDVEKMHQESVFQVKNMIGETSEEHITTQKHQKQLIDALKEVVLAKIEATDEIVRQADHTTTQVKQDLRTSVERIFEQLHKDESQQISFANNIKGQFEKQQAFFQKMKQTSEHNQFVMLKELQYNYDRVDALFSIYNVLKPTHALPIMHNWRISSDYGLALVNTMLDSQKGIVLDVGSGITTILAGYCIKKKGKGKVISLEHDPFYFEKTKQLIQEHGLEEFISLHLCPLVNYKIDKKDWLWYDISEIKMPKNIDVISVDGPPGATQPLARYPIVPILIKNKITYDSLLLDDANREDEKNIVDKWEKESNISPVLIKSHKDYFIINKK